MNLAHIKTFDRLLTIPRPSESSRTRRIFRTSPTMATSRRKPRWNDNAKTLRSLTIEVGWLVHDEIKPSAGEIWWIISCLPSFPSCTTLFIAVYHPNICNEFFLPSRCCIRGVVAKTESYETRSGTDLEQALTLKFEKLFCLFFVLKPLEASVVWVWGWCQRQNTAVSFFILFASLSLRTTEIGSPLHDCTWSCIEGFWHWFKALASLFGAASTDFPFSPELWAQGSR